MMMLVMFSLYAVGLYFGSTLSAYPRATRARAAVILHYERSRARCCCHTEFLPYDPPPPLVCVLVCAAVQSLRAARRTPNAS